MTTLVELGEEVRFLGPIRTRSTFWTVFYFRRAQRDPAKKTSKLRPNSINGGFGGMQLKIEMNLEA